MGALFGCCYCCCYRCCSLWSRKINLFHSSLVPEARQLALHAAAQMFVFQILCLSVVVTQKSWSKMMFLACFSLNNRTHETQATQFCRAFLALQSPEKIYEWRSQRPEIRAFFSWKIQTQNWIFDWSSWPLLVLRSSFHQTVKSHWSSNFCIWTQRKDQVADLKMATFQSWRRIFPGFQVQFSNLQVPACQGEDREQQDIKQNKQAWRFRCMVFHQGTKQ